MVAGRILTNIPSTGMLGSEQDLLAEDYWVFVRMVIQD